MSMGVGWDEHRCVVEGVFAWLFNFAAYDYGTKNVTTSTPHSYSLAAC